MRIQVINGGPLSGWLTREGYLITNKDPDYTIECVPTDHNYIAISTGNIELENLLIEKLRELGEKTFLIDKSPPLSDRKLTIKVPTDCNSDVERGIFRAFVMYLLKNSVVIAPLEPKPEVPPVPWYKRLFPLQLAIAFLSFAVDTNAQDGMTFIQLWTSSGPVYAADFANNAMRVNVVAGAGSGGTASSFGAAFPATGTAAGFISSTGNMAGANLDASGNLEVSCLVGCSGSSFADSTPLTFGVTSVSVFAAVVDDTGTNTVAENSAGAPRMNTNRILYTMSTNSTGTQVGTAGAPIRTDPTGTTTQPVSAVSLPLPTGAATSALQTQPGVDIGDVTINNAAGASAVNIQDGGNIITVDGTVTATGPLTDAQLRASAVPVSGTVTTTPPANASTNITQYGSVATTLGQKTASASMPTVLASDYFPAERISGPTLISAICADPCNTPETANSFVKVSTVGTFGGAAIEVAASTADGVFICDETKDDVHWTPVTCINVLSADRGAIIDPVAFSGYVVNITPGSRAFRVRAITLTSGTATFALYANNNFVYAGPLSHTSWEDLTTAPGNGETPVAQRGDNIILADTNCTVGQNGWPCSRRLYGSNKGLDGEEYGAIVRTAPARNTGTLSVACADPGTACAANSTVAIALGGQSSVTWLLSATTGAPTITVKFDHSYDSTNGIDGNWLNDGSLSNSFVAATAAAGLVNPTAVKEFYVIGIPPAALWARVRAHSLTTSTATFYGAATTMGGPQAFSYIRPNGFATTSASVSVGGSFNVTAPTYTDTQMTQTQYTNRGDLKVAQKTSTLMVVAKSAANAIVTATLPAPGAGLFHYITWLRIVRMCTTAITGTAVLDVTTTNLATSVTFSTGNACAVGSTNPVVESNFSSPMQSTTANTATTIVCPAIGAAGICKIEVMYYTGS